MSNAIKTNRYDSIDCNRVINTDNNNNNESDQETMQSNFAAALINHSREKKLAAIKEGYSMITLVLIFILTACYTGNFASAFFICLVVSLIIYKNENINFLYNTYGRCI